MDECLLPTSACCPRELVSPQEPDSANARHDDPLFLWRFTTEPCTYVRLRALVRI